jgi:bacillithiol system protein YtxJ
MEQIYTLEDWERVLEESHKGPVVVYKHSSTCGACMRNFNEMHEGVMYKEIIRPVFYLTVQESRELSDRIAADLMLEHQSPQAIVVMNERACYHAYSDEINVADIAAKIDMIWKAYTEINDPDWDPAAE